MMVTGADIVGLISYSLCLMDDEISAEQEPQKCTTDDAVPPATATTTARYAAFIRIRISAIRRSESCPPPPTTHRTSEQCRREAGPCQDQIRQRPSLHRCR